MNVYRVTYNNGTASCEELRSDVFVSGLYTYERAQGKFFYAMVKPDSIEHAVRMGKHIIDDVASLRGDNSN